MGGQGLVRTEGGGLSERGLLMVMVVLVVVDVEVAPMASWQEPDLIEFLEHSRTHVVVLDQCEYGLCTPGADGVCVVIQHWRCM